MCTCIIMSTIHMSLFIYAFMTTQTEGSTYYVSSLVSGIWTSNSQVDYVCDDGPNGICNIHCDLPKNQMTAITFHCGNARECNFYCEARKCAESANIIATNSSNLHVIIGNNADECMKNVIIQTPNYGNATFDSGYSNKGFNGMQVYAGSNTQNIIIDFIGGDRCQMEVYAATAQYVQISLGEDVEWVKGILQCPVNSIYGTSRYISSASCMIYGSGALSNTHIIAIDGIPENVWFHPGITYVGSNTLTCNTINGLSLTSIAPFDTNSECWFTYNPTNIPTNSPIVQPTFQPTLQPTSKPTFQPTFQPTLQPISQQTLQPTSQLTSAPTSQPIKSPQVTNYPSEMYMSMYPSEFPTGFPTESPTKQSHQPSETHSTKMTVIVSVTADSESISPKQKTDFISLLEDIDIIWYIIVIVVVFICCCGCCLKILDKRDHSSQPQAQEPAQKYSISDDEKVKINIPSKSFPSKSKLSPSISKSSNYSNYSNYGYALPIVSPSSLYLSPIPSGSISTCYEYYANQLPLPLPPPPPPPPLPHVVEQQESAPNPAPYVYVYQLPASLPPPPPPPPSPYDDDDDRDADYRDADYRSVLSYKSEATSDVYVSETDLF